jgi:hypothetical protein
MPPISLQIQITDVGLASEVSSTRSPGGRPGKPVMMLPCETG